MGKHIDILVRLGLPTPSQDKQFYIGLYGELYDLLSQPVMRAEELEKAKNIINNPDRFSKEDVNNAANLLIQFHKTKGTDTV